MGSEPLSFRVRRFAPPGMSPASELRLRERSCAEPVLENGRIAAGVSRSGGIDRDDRDAGVIGPQTLGKLQEGMVAKAALAVRQLQQDGRWSGDDGEDVFGRFERSGHAREAKLRKLGRQRPGGRALTVINDKDFLKRIHTPTSHKATAKPKPSSNACPAEWFHGDSMDARIGCKNRDNCDDVRARSSTPDRHSAVRPGPR